VLTAPSGLSTSRLPIATAVWLPGGNVEKETKAVDGRVKVKVDTAPRSTEKRSNAPADRKISLSNPIGSKDAKAADEKKDKKELDAAERVF